MTVNLSYVARALLPETEATTFENELEDYFGMPKPGQTEMLRTLRDIVQHRVTSTDPYANDDLIEDFATQAIPRLQDIRIALAEIDRAVICEKEERQARTGGRFKFDLAIRASYRRATRAVTLVPQEYQKELLQRIAHLRAYLVPTRAA